LKERQGVERLLDEKRDPVSENEAKGVGLEANFGICG
jgi:hypothetical protein